MSTIAIEKTSQLNADVLESILEHDFNKIGRLLASTWYQSEVDDIGQLKKKIDELKNEQVTLSIIDGFINLYQQDNPSITFNEYMLDLKEIDTSPSVTKLGYTDKTNTNNVWNRCFTLIEKYYTIDAISKYIEKSCILIDEKIQTHTEKSDNIFDRILKIKQFKDGNSKGF